MAGRLRPAIGFLVVATLGAATQSAPALARTIDVRTIRASEGPSGADPFADSRHASLSATGRFVAFDSNGTRLSRNDENGPTRDVFVRDTQRRTTTIVSRAAGGPPADGPSESPAISGGGQTVAFVSSASTLLGTDSTGAGLDSNGLPDVYVNDHGRISRVSVAAGGGDADGASYPPDISADGRFVAFASDATNLVPGDANGLTDVFVRDLRTGDTTMISRSADGTSSTPAISPDGRYVSFSSTADDLVADDTNKVADVFLADRRTGAITRVSVNSGEREQDFAVTAPFVPVSDVSSGGRYVVFDSDAHNLVRSDTNKATDVFLRDVRGGTTRRLSETPARRQTDSDSFFPTITPNGRYVSFESFASNLSDADGPAEDVFVYDRQLHAPVLVDVPVGGGVKGKEHIRQILQKTAVSDDAHVAAFSSTADNLAGGDPGATQDVYVRRLAPATAHIKHLHRTVLDRAPYRLAADDPAAREFRCTIDGRAFACRAHHGRLPHLKAGVHRIAVRAGGPGLLWQTAPSRLSFTVR